MTSKSHDGRRGGDWEEDLSLGSSSYSSVLRFGFGFYNSFRTFYMMFGMNAAIFEMFCKSPGLLYIIFSFSVQLYNFVTFFIFFSSDCLSLSVTVYLSLSLSGCIVLSLSLSVALSVCLSV